MERLLMQSQRAQLADKTLSNLSFRMNRKLSLIQLATCF